MADYPEKTSDQYVRESTYRVEPAPESTGSLWFILGGIVVALLVLFAIFYGFGGDGTDTVPADGGAVTIENNDMAPPADPAAPAADPAVPAAPADEVAPPANEAAPPAGDAAPADGGAVIEEPAPAAPAAGGN